MKQSREPGSQSVLKETDLYFVGGVHVKISQSDLVNFFSKYVPVDAITLRPSKSPASKGFAFLRTSKVCDLISLVGVNPEMLGHILSIEPAEDPKLKLLSLQSRAMRKVFIGNIPQRMTPEQFLAAVLLCGPVERLTRFRVKSDRTKYCYAIMQHLEHAQQLTNMKRLKVVDPQSNSNAAVLSLGSFIPKSKQPLQFLESKYQPGDHHQKTQGIRKVPDDSWGMSFENTLLRNPYIEDTDEIGITSTPNPNEASNLNSATKRRLDRREGRLPLPNRYTFGDTYSQPKQQKVRKTTNGIYSEVLLRKNLLMKLHNSDESDNLRFNILLD
jgi:RNA recognition motif-containing protein